MRYRTSRVAGGAGDDNTAIYNIDNTSLADTAGSTVVVGEVIEYVGVMTLPELEARLGI